MVFQFKRFFLAWVIGLVVLVSRPASSSDEFVGERVAEIVRINSAPPEQVNQTTAVFEFSADVAGYRFECALDSGAPFGCASPLTRRGLTEREHVLCVRGIRADGTEEVPVCHTWTVDLTKPVVNISEPANAGGVATAKPRITGTASEPLCTVQVYLDEQNVGSAVADADGKWNFTVPTELTIAKHKVRAVATDRAGNVGDTSATVEFTVETEPPTTSIVEGPPAIHSSAHAVFEFSSPSGAKSFECQLDNASEFSPCDEVWLVKRLAEGPHKLRVRAKDIAGNVDPAPREHEWTVDFNAAPCSPAENDSGGGCASAGAGQALGLLSGILMLAVRRRRV